MHIANDPMTDKNTFLIIVSDIIVISNRRVRSLS